MFIESPMGLWNVDHITIKGGSNSYLKLGPLTTTQRDALDAKNGTMIYNSTTGVINSYEGGSWGAIGSGDVVGPAASTNNAIARFDLATGKLLQNSGVIINDTDDISGVHGLTSTAHIDLGSSWDFRAHNLTADALTAGRVVFTGASGLLSVDSAFVWDNTNKRLAVGNTLPLTSLDVQGIITTRSAAADTPGSATEGLRMSLTGYATTSLYANSIFNSVSATPISALMQFRVASGTGTQATVMSMLGNGNVGIATTAPSALLDINSDILRLRTAKTPATSGAAGNTGDICWDADYIYVCIATNTWERAAIAAW